jgi:hypothetical protein
MVSNQDKKDIKIRPSLIKEASQNKTDAIITMFRQFIPENEEICFAQYLGIQGLWGFGDREFACLTDRRVADITVARFGKVTYQDGYLEHINSTFIYQPSKIGIYLIIGFMGLIILSFCLGILLTPELFILLKLLFILLILGLGAVILPFIIQTYYRFNKSGIVIAVRGGLPVYIFTNRGLLTRANELLRQLSISREHRIKLRGVV